MNSRINFIERKYGDSLSIETVFRGIARELEASGLRYIFQKVPFGNGIADIARNLIRFKATRSDIYHITGHVHYLTLILPVEKTVLTIHDLTILKHRRGLRRYVLKKLFYDLPVRRAKYITAISQNTKEELIAATGCPPTKVRVVENPLLIEPDRFGLPFNSIRPTILHIGTSPNKNLHNLICALRGIDCRLIIVGSLDTLQRQQLSEDNIDFENASNLNSSEMRETYRTADIVTLCSTSEGFGLPIIEGQAMGKPVITSDRSPMKDVAGKGALLIDPDDIDSIRSGILRIIDGSELRESLVSAGYENIKRFAPSAIAEAYRAIYEEILSETRTAVSANRYNQHNS